ncbi:hypothetical protein [Slackia isoflavoniconvertens]|uniref:hypothetical protein n=1 Tax=Slackia isoflavoniconvertens TaxID=572010 RepID=UPI003AF1AB1A
MEDAAITAIATAGSQLAVLAAKGTATQVSNRFQAIRQKKTHEELCNSYEELINELVAERAQAIAIAQAYESELNRYEITDEDIEHLQNTVGHALDILKSFSPDSDFSNFERFKSLLSVDTLKAMQLLGFDYKKAIGDPLTEVCADAIRVNLGQKKKRLPTAITRKSVTKLNSQFPKAWLSRCLPRCWDWICHPELAMRVVAPVFVGGREAFQFHRGFG